MQISDVMLCVYIVFTGKDASCGLGKSSLKKEDAHADYSGLDETETKTLNDWYTYFSKRYNIVGKVTPDTTSVPEPSAAGPEANPSL